MTLFLYSGKKPPIEGPRLRGVNTLERLLTMFWPCGILIIET